MPLNRKDELSLSPGSKRNNNASHHVLQHLGWKPGIAAWERPVVSNTCSSRSEDKERVQCPQSSMVTERPKVQPSSCRRIYSKARYVLRTCRDSWMPRNNRVRASGEHQALSEQRWRHFPHSLFSGFKRCCLLGSTCKRVHCILPIASWLRPAALQVATSVGNKPWT